MSKCLFHKREPKLKGTWTRANSIERRLDSIMVGENVHPKKRLKNVAELCLESWQRRTILERASEAAVNTTDLAKT